jgi:predicted Zn-dependent protease
MTFVSLICAALALQAAAHRPSAPSFTQLSSEADAARQAGKADKAADLYRRALLLKPEWKEGLWYLGGIEYSRDHYPACQEVMLRLVQVEPRGSPGWTMLGLCDYGAHDYPAALEHLRNGQTLGLGGSQEIDRVAKYHLAMLFARSGAFEQALELYYALAKAGTPPSQALLEGAGLAALHNPALPEQLPAKAHESAYLAGKAFWDVSSGHAAEAKQDFSSLVSKYPDLPNVHFYYGSYLLTNDPDEGLVELQRELARSPRNLPALITAAVEHLRRGETAKALPLAREAVQIEPDSFAAHTVLGRILVESGELAKGVAELEAARRLSPESPQPRIALASAYAKLGRREEAARERKEFLRLQELAKKPGER